MIMEFQSFDETTKIEDINNLFKIFGIKDELKNIDNVKINSIKVRKKKSILNSKVFNTYHSETKCFVI